MVRRIDSWSKNSSIGELNFEDLAAVLVYLLASEEGHLDLGHAADLQAEAVDPVRTSAASTASERR